MRAATNQQILVALRSGNMRVSAVAKRAGLTRQMIRVIAKNHGLTAKATNAAYEARQDKIWEEIKRKVRDGK